MASAHCIHAQVSVCRSQLRLVFDVDGDKAIDELLHINAGVAEIPHGGLDGGNTGRRSRQESAVEDEGLEGEVETTPESGGPEADEAQQVA